MSERCLYVCMSNTDSYLSTNQDLVQCITAVNNTSQVLFNLHDYIRPDASCISKTNHQISCWKCIVRRQCCKMNLTRTSNSWVRMSWCAFLSWRFSSLRLYTFSETNSTRHITYQIDWEHRLHRDGADTELLVSHSSNDSWFSKMGTERWCDDALYILSALTEGLLYILLNPSKANIDKTIKTLSRPYIWLGKSGNTILKNLKIKYDTPCLLCCVFMFLCICTKQTGGQISHCIKNVVFLAHKASKSTMTTVQFCAL